MNTKRDACVLTLFALAIIFASCVILADEKTPEFRVGKPMYDEVGGFYVLEVYYDRDHYFVACFDKPEELSSFASLKTVKRTMPVNQ